MIRGFHASFFKSVATGGTNTFGERHRSREFDLKDRVAGSISRRLGWRASCAAFLLRTARFVADLSGDSKLPSLGILVRRDGGFL